LRSTNPSINSTTALNPGVSHGNGNYTCNSRAARRNGKKTIEEK
jgi:hypothetical protein